MDFSFTEDPRKSDLKGAGVKRGNGKSYKAKLENNMRTHAAGVTDPVRQSWGAVCGERSVEEMMGVSGMAKCGDE